jgi:cell division protein FtsA
MEEKYIASIDLGSSKIALTVARIEGENIQVIYYEETPSEGIRNSCVFNPKMVEDALRIAVEKAESALKIKILQAVVNLPRYYVRQETATAKIERNAESGYISQEEVDNLKGFAVDSYPLDDSQRQTIYGAVAQSFATEEAIQEPEGNIVGMNSSFLEGNFKVFIGSRRYSENIDMIFNNLGIALAKKYFVPSILPIAVLKPDQQENGVALIDFGAGVTSVTLFTDHILRHYSAIPFGGKTITNDIRNECMISEQVAENIKKAYGGCMKDNLQTLAEKTLQIEEEESVRTRIPVKYLSEVITTRVKEIIDAILYEIQMSGFADQLRSGVVVTGGGANLLNCANYIKELSGYNVSIGFPRNLFSYEGCAQIKDPAATASVAMILAAKEDNMLSCTDKPPILRKTEEAEKKPLSNGEQTEATLAGTRESSERNGRLFEPEAFGPEVEKPKKVKVPKKPKPEGPKIGEILWRKLGNLFEDMKDEEV